MQVHNAVDHDDEGGDEQHENKLTTPVERGDGGRAGVMHAEELGEMLAIFVGVRRLGVLLDLLAVPVQIGDDYDCAHDAADDAPLDAFGPGNACGVRGDNDGERVDRGERGAHGAGEEDGADADDGVVSQGEEDGYENRIERDRLFLKTAGRAAQNHQDADEEYQEELAALGLFRQGDKARFECA